MKKYLIIALLLASLILTGCNTSSNNESENDQSGESNDNVEVNNDSSSESKSDANLSDEDIIDFSKVSVQGTPVYENGLIVIYFTRENVSYTADSACSVGVISDLEAYSIKATPDLTAYPDMLVSEGKYKGIALRPSEDLDSGSFKFSITVGEYIIDTFEMTIQ
ncbi:MAG: hypothetical protein E7672_06535 [Ruminococcaceae bacterium]|nr:hypothetical protein [Oscillospiraceae bacterium]